MNRDKEAPSKRRGRRTDLKVRKEIKDLVSPDPNRRDLLIEYLHIIQDKYGCIDSKQIGALANLMKLSMSEVFEVATFYHHFIVVQDRTMDAPKKSIKICDSITCDLFGSEHLIEAIKGKNPHKDLSIQRVSCVGRCDRAPVAVYGQNTIEHASVEKINKAIESNAVAPVQPKCFSFQEYGNANGYSSYKECLDGSRSVEEIIKNLSRSNLRGLGGAGFPTAKKWEIVRQQPAPRVLVVNIDEGEPGTFKDRFFLEKDPHRFLEGMLIAAWAISAETCYIYLRDEYAGCRLALQHEIDLLVKSNTFFVPKIELRRGAGAYICGEESALLESIEGKRGMPRHRPPYIAEKGLFGRPTLAHNMETLYWIREIIEKSPDWFVSQGRKGRKGLRSYSVSGRVRNPGVYIAPAGTTAKELIENYCGGMLEGHTFYGYFPGGASGGILPASKSDLPLDFESLESTGCFIGSAAIIVLSSSDQAKNSALNAMKFFARESCGQCTPCRVGTNKAVQLMSSENWEIGVLENLATVMEDSSICGLGQAASNPLRSVLKYFKREIHDAG